MLDMFIDCHVNRERRPDHAERCLGHVIGGVRGVYDRYAFLDEKRCAFEALAAIIDHIRSA